METPDKANLRPEFNPDGTLRDYKHIVGVNEEAPPNSNILSAIKPKIESKTATTLEYSYDLDKKINEMFNEQNWHNIEKELNSAIDQEEFEEAKNITYLAYLAWRTNDESRSIEERQVWANTYTKQSEEIYGKPDPELAKIFEMGGAEKIIEKYGNVFSGVRDYLNETYRDEFNALGTDQLTDRMSSEEITESFNRGLDVLKTKDNAWKGWSAMQPDSDVILVAGSKKQIQVGKKRLPEKPTTVKGIFAHEVLRHAMTNVNGKKNDINKSLPYYIAAEEGFAIINEVAVSGEFPDKIVDRYVDIAYALGDIDGKKHTRQELVDRYIKRENTRDSDLSEEDIKQKAYAHVNRIFRGTPGNEEVAGIYTKDAVYLAGLIPALEYIQSRLDKGISIKDTMEFITSAKFNPSDKDHVEYVGKKLIDRYLPKTLALPPAKSHDRDVL